MFDARPCRKIPANQPIENINRIRSISLPCQQRPRRLAFSATSRPVKSHRRAIIGGSMAERTCLAIVLAAGEGTRMRSARPKVLHEIAGQSMLSHVLAAVDAAGGSALAVVVGPDADAVCAEATRAAPSAQLFIQRERRGTAHAVLTATEALMLGADDVPSSLATRR
jgi:hypothetical protein